MDEQVRIWCTECHLKLEHEKWCSRYPFSQLIDDIIEKRLADSFCEEEVEYEKKGYAPTLRLCGSRLPCPEHPIKGETK